MVSAKEFPATITLSTLEFCSWSDISPASPTSHDIASSNGIGSSSEPSPKPDIRMSVSSLLLIVLLRFSTHATGKIMSSTSNFPPATSSPYTPQTTPVGKLAMRKLLFRNEPSLSFLGKSLIRWSSSSKIISSLSDIYCE